MKIFFGLLFSVVFIIVLLIGIGDVYFWNKAKLTITAYDTKEGIVRWHLGGFNYAIYTIDLTKGIELIAKRRYFPFGRSIALGKNYITGKESSNNCFAIFGRVEEVNKDTCRELSDLEKYELQTLREEGRKKLKEFISTPKNILQKPSITL